VVCELAVGEALVSFLDATGSPGIVERAFVVPPYSQIGPVTPDQRQQIIKSSLVFGHYEQTIDRESAFERLKSRTSQTLDRVQVPEAPKESPAPSKSQPRQRETIVEAMAKSAMRAAGTQIGRQIIRGVLGSIFGGKR